MIYVTKTYLPDFKEYTDYLKEIWDSELPILTNDGPLSKKLEANLQDYLGLDNLYFCSNGTIVLQIALKILEETFGYREGEIITTPFSYVATTNVILWERMKPVFVDIDPNTLCINAQLIENAITDKTRAILATHVYGNACDIETIENIAKKHNLIVIYDGAHAFGAKLNNKSLLSYGDFSTCSFHATKLFHSVEGGIITTNRPEWHNYLKYMRAFGHKSDEYYFMGINAKNSELHAAMGLCNLPQVPDLIARRKTISDLYTSLLDWHKLSKPKLVEGLVYNYAYYPVVFESENQLQNVFEHLGSHGIFPRRYFYPSLNRLDFVKGNSCPVAEDIAVRVACLPLHAYLAQEHVQQITSIINQNL